MLKSEHALHVCHPGLLVNELISCLPDNLQKPGGVGRRWFGRPQAGDYQRAAAQFLQPRDTTPGKTEAFSKVDAFIIKSVQQVDHQGGLLFRENAFQQAEHLMTGEGACDLDSLQRPGVQPAVEAAEPARYGVGVEAVSGIHHPQGTVQCQTCSGSQHAVAERIWSGDHKQSLHQQLLAGQIDTCRHTGRRTGWRSG